MKNVIKKARETASKIVDRMKDATTPTTTHDDGKFIRTALVVANDADKKRDCGSIDVVRIVNGKVERLGQINIFFAAGAGYDGKELLMVDVIDVDNRYTTRRAMAFSVTRRAMIEVPEGGNLVASHFERKL